MDPALAPFRGSTSALARTSLHQHLRLMRDVYVDDTVEAGFERDCRAALVAVPDGLLDR